MLVLAVWQFVDRLSGLQEPMGAPEALAGVRSIYGFVSSCLRGCEKSPARERSVPRVGARARVTRSALSFAKIRPDGKA
jgi:hypothetical protein